MQSDRQPTLPGTPAFFGPSTPDLQTREVPDHQLLCLIGQGSFGEVWLARNAIGTLRAVKIVHRPRFERSEDFEREFKGLLKFEPISRSHDGLVDILQIGRRDNAGYFFYVMELADAVPNPNDERRKPNEIQSPNDEKATAPDDLRASDFGFPSSFDIRHLSFYSPHTLRSELQTRGHLAPDQCVAIGLKLAAALEHLHASGLVHRDIKPSNIIFVNGEPKLADIGLVTAIDEAHSMVGTAGYIPPEGPGTPQADLYSLGKVLYEISFGKGRHEFPQLPPDLQTRPEHAALLELNEVVIKACESDPRKRYQSAAVMRADLELLQVGKSVKSKRTRERQWSIAKKLGFAGAAVALLLTALMLLRGHTPDPEAVRLYEMGRWQYNRLTPEAHEQALKYLTQAVQKDPKFMRPYGEWMALYAWNNLPGASTNEQIRLQKVQEIADKALAINPNAAEGHLALSWARFLQRDWHGAEAEIQRAIQLNPNLALAHGAYCFYLSMQRRTQEAHREGKRAVDLEPPESRRATAIIAAWPFVAERRFDLAIDQLRKVMELDRNFAGGHSYLGEYYEANSNYMAAIEEYRTAALLDTRNPEKVNAQYRSLLEAYDTGGREGYLRKRIELILSESALPEEQRTLGDIGDRELAGFYARLGEKEKALDQLEKHFNEPQAWNQIKFLPQYDTLRDEPRFKELVKRAGLSE